MSEQQLDPSKRFPQVPNKGRTCYRMIVAVPNVLLYSPQPRGKKSQTINA
jgi:hypothetical protein